jgi:hypothetical protein
MRRFLLTATLLSAPILALPGRARARPIEGVYVDLGLGANWLSGQPSDTVQQGHAPITIAPDRTHFDTGARVLAGVGYGFANGLRIELEGTAFGNVRTPARTSARTSGPVTPAVALSNGSASAGSGTAGVFANAIYEFDIARLALPVTVRPYLGVGVGYADTYRSDLPRIQPGTSYDRFRGNRGGVAGQFIAGAALPIDVVPGLAITAEYRATVTSGGRYTATLSGPGASRQVALDAPGGINNAVLIGLRYAFGRSAAPPPPTVSR